jgi:hypothetical protein
MTDWKARCAELLQAIDDDVLDAAIDRTLAALAQPAPEGPTDEEITDLWSWSAGQNQGPWPTRAHCAVRVALQLWGRPAINPVPAAEGEAADLARDIRNMADNCDIASGFEGWGTMLIRVAELLEQLQPIKPVPVSERPWEREKGWNDPDGECWWCPPDGPPYWQMANPAMVYSGWLLPHWALPVPASQEIL